jgi:hypothetical protein
MPSPPTARRTFTQGDVLAVSAEIYRPSERLLVLLRRPGETPSEFVVRVAEAGLPQRVVIEQPLPVLGDGHRTPYVSFTLPTTALAPGRYVMRLVRRSGSTPPDEAPGGVIFEVLASAPRIGSP